DVYKRQGGARSWNVSVDAKNIDNVPGLEIAVTYSPQESYKNTNDNVRGRFELYHYKENDIKQFLIGSEGETDPLFNSSAPNNQYVIPTDIKLAQLTSGGNYEVAVAGHVTHADNWEHAVIDSAEIDLMGLQLLGHSRYEWTAVNPVIDWRPELIAWHADDKGDLLVFNDQVVRRQLDAQNSLPSMVSMGRLPVREPNGYRLKAAVVNFSHPNDTGAEDFSELYYMWLNNTTGNLYSGNDFIHEAYLNGQGQIVDVNIPATGITAEQYPYQQITAVNWKNDETLAVYEGHQLRYSEPQVYAILASAPFYQDQHNPAPTAGTSLSLAYNSGSSTEGTASHGWNVEYGMNFEASGGFIAQGKVIAEASQYFENEFSQSWLNGIEHGVSVTFNGGLGDDTVVLSILPTDHYSYSMVSNVSSIEEGMTASGEADFVIDIPRPMKLATVTLKYMKDHQLENQYINLDQIDSLLGHKPGFPNTYMRKSEFINKIADLSDSSDIITFKGNNPNNMASANQGIGTTTVDMSISYGTSSGQTSGFTQTVGGNGTLGFGVKTDVPVFGEAEFSSTITAGGWGAISNTYTISADSSSSITGVIPNLSPDDVDVRHLVPFNWGIVGFPIDLNPTKGEYGAVRKPLLVTYWVEDASL
ncbi:hypothetical protein, partial [Vibrio mediterranei]|uniref:hypothetical protein n=1 Tax=Vibrio mediterranei TaxID=689 RepID=UPI00148E360D